jgi:CUB domain
MKLLLVTLLVLNLAVGGWAVPIEDPVVEETALSFKQLLDKNATMEDIIIRSACNGTYSGESATISTPNFPSDYPSNMNCYWLIIVSTGSLIRLSFDTFVVASSDYLRV